MAFENTTLLFADTIGVLLEKIFDLFHSISGSYIFILVLFMLIGLIIMLSYKVKEVGQ